MIHKNNITGEIFETNETMDSLPMQTPQEPTLEEQVSEIKTTLTTVVDTLAEIVGVV